MAIRKRQDSSTIVPGGWSVLPIRSRVETADREIAVIDRVGVFVNKQEGAGWLGCDDRAVLSVGLYAVPLNPVCITIHVSVNQVTAVSFDLACARRRPQLVGGALINGERRVVFPHRTFVQDRNVLPVGRRRNRESVIDLRLRNTQMIQD